MNTVTMTMVGLLTLALASIAYWLGRVIGKAERQALAQADSASCQQEITRLQQELALSKQLIVQKAEAWEELKAAETHLREDLSKWQEKSADLQSELSKSVGQREQLESQIKEAHERVKQGEQQIDKWRLEHAASRTRVAELETEIVKDKEALSNERRQQEEAKRLLKQEFENLAHDIFEKKQQTFSEQSKQGLNILLAPFKQQLESFRQRVDEVHTQNVQGQASLKSELDKLRELNQQVTTEATNLTRALKGDKKLQGNWGEQKVELLLEQSGLRRGIEYEREKNFKDEENNNRRPDFVVHLPENKHIIIDSKVSLVDYSEYVGAQTEDTRHHALMAHVQALRNHINALAGKNYPELTGMNSPDFVFLFVAIEPAYLAAAESSPGLFQEAYEKRIAIVTATTLLPVLRVVANLWSLQRQNQSTRQLAEQAGAVYEKLRGFVEKMERLGKQIHTVQTTYSDAFNTLKDGRGSLAKQVDKFVDLGVKITKRLPSSVLEGEGDIEGPGVDADPDLQFSEGDQR